MLKTCLKNSEKRTCFKLVNLAAGVGARAVLKLSNESNCGDSSMADFELLKRCSAVNWIHTN